jgi:hypothetical protein
MGWSCSSHGTREASECCPGHAPEMVTDLHGVLVAHVTTWKWSRLLLMKVPRCLLIVMFNPSLCNACKIDSELKLDHAVQTGTEVFELEISGSLWTRNYQRLSGYQSEEDQGWNINWQTVPEVLTLLTELFPPYTGDSKQTFDVWFHFDVTECDWNRPPVSQFRYILQSSNPFSKYIHV